MRYTGGNEDADVGGTIAFPAWVQVLGPGGEPLPQDRKERAPARGTAERRALDSRARIGALAAGGRHAVPGTPVRHIRRPNTRDGRLQARADQIPPPTGAQNWEVQGACGDADPEMFFADADSADTQVAIGLYCKKCPVQGDCLVDAVRSGEKFGTRGGFTQKEQHTQVVRAAAALLAAQIEAVA